MTFSASWTPGPDAVAGMRAIGYVHDQAVLTLEMEGESLIIAPPQAKADWPDFVRFLRDLRDGADELAEFLDPNDAPFPNVTLIRDRFADSGGGS